jgi:hypothetical protein
MVYYSIFSDFLQVKWVFNWANHPAITSPLPDAVSPQEAASPALTTPIPPAITVPLPATITGPACGPSPWPATASPIMLIGAPFTITDGTPGPVIVPPALSTPTLLTPGIM